MSPNHITPEAADMQMALYSSMMGYAGPVDGYRPRQNGPTDPGTRKQIEARRRQRKAARKSQQRNRR